MAIESHELITYAVSLASGPDAASGARPAATIHGRTSPSKKREVQVYMRFYRGAVDMPPSSRIEGPDKSITYMVSYPYEMLADAVDLLRHEKPMFFNYNEKGATGYIATSDEPVGEGDMDADFFRALTAQVGAGAPRDSEPKDDGRPPPPPKRSDK